MTTTTTSDRASSPAPILVLGATGKTGSRILRRLQDRGLPVRAGSRRADPPFDWDRPETWAAALAGVGSVYVSFVPDLAVEGAPAAIERLVDEAREAGVRRMVLLSGRGEPNAQRCEQIVLQSGLEATVVRASWFAQNFDEGVLAGGVHAGVVAVPAREDLREPFVDVDDLADVAVAALTEPGHAGEVYEVTGPRLMTFGEVAAALSEAVGRPIAFVPMTHEAFHAAVLEAEGPETADFLGELMRETLDGRNAHLADGVQRALGRPARDFVDYARDAAARGAWEVSA